MKAWFAGVGLTLWLAMVCVGVPAGAAEVPAVQARDVQQTVRAQLRALAVDDAEAAFAQAAPGIRKVFDTPERFIGMVRQAYPMVYRPASVVFMAAIGAEGDVLQPVRMTDTAGRVWRVLYRLQRQPDGAWRIAGCEVEPSAGSMI